jgi:polyphosphate kinase
MENPAHFINRELSLLAFNQRVLAQALDSRIPLLERLKFLCISSANLDEFFEIRVAGIQKLHERVITGPEGLSAQEALLHIAKRAHALVDEQYRVFNQVVVPALTDQGIRFLRRANWTPAVQAWVKHTFESDLLPILTPIGLDPAHPFPRLLNKSLNFIIALSGKDAFGRQAEYAIVQAPRALPRLMRVPESVCGHENDFVFLSSVIHAQVDQLFPGMEATGCYQFRVTRNSDLWVDEEDADDLAEALKDELSQRQWGDTVRLEVAHNCPEQARLYLMEELQLQEEDVFRCDGPVNLMRLMAIPDLVDRPDLKYPPFTPKVPKAFQGDIFAAVRGQDHLLHHPYEAFTPVIDWLRQAAKDPKVLAIKQTLYRTGAKSPVVEALIEAAKAGKEVTVVVELRARFDEADNIDVATRLQEVGAHVSYGVVGYKTHAKMLLMVRQEDDGLRHYVHLGTGNYHPRTARLYTDYGLFSSHPALCKDVAAVFLQLTGLGRVMQHSLILQSPFTLQKGFLNKIQCEIDHAQAGKPARILAKMNSLVEPEMINALYQASQAGVTVELIVRGMCSLRPQVLGLSENIRVRSVIGRFLEHPRCFIFSNDGDKEVWLSSADWMERNLYRRVEIAFPLLDKAVKAKVIEQLESYVTDTTQSWFLQPEGHYTPPEDREAEGVQNQLLRAYA